MRKLNCFIASGFGQKDVDAVFIKGVAKVLKELKINCHRVDKINHNDKIDNKIIQLITECDFGIVDLTFARPSVYYEAGLLEGQNKPVIFISRSDHFKPRQEDTFGNFRIHFDLITKNIIPWNKPTQLFSNKLKARIKLVTKPLINKLAISEVEIEAQNKFEQLSISKRFELIRERVLEFAETKKYAYQQVRGTGIKRLVKGKKQLSIEVFNSITTTQLSDIGYRSFNREKNDGEKIILLCLLKPITKNRIEHALIRFSPISENTYSFFSTKLIILQPITSLLNLELRLKDISI